jgi:hypothetical protein
MIYAYSGLGVAATCLTISATLLGVGLAQRGTAHSAYLASTTQADRDAHWDEVKLHERKIWASYATGGIGLAALAFAAYHYFTRAPAAKPASGVSFSAHPGTSGAQASFAVSFYSY